VEKVYLTILNRRPQTGEIDQALTYVSGFQTKFSAPELEAWQSYYRILLASNDFIYVD
jgi:hypothetical protein